MNKKTRTIIIIAISIFLVGIIATTYAYFAAMTSGTSRVNVETKTSSRTVISVGNNDTVALTVLPEDMREGLTGTNYAESSNEESGNLYASVTLGGENEQVCTLKVAYEADEGYVFERSHYCAKDGEANTYGTCAEGYEAHTTSEITTLPEYALYLTPTVNVGYLDTGAEEIDISDINDTTETIIKTYTWKLPVSDASARVDINVKARYYNLDFDQNSSADKTYTGNVSLSVYCVAETAILNQTLTRLHLSTADILDDGIDLLVNNSGLYKSEDDYGTSLVFRGIVGNNWAKFGKESVSTNCINGAKDIMSATGEKITVQATCETTYTYSCSNENTIFVGTTSTLDACTTLGLTVSSGNVTGTYKSTAVTIEKDIYWRGVRINGNGNLRMIYSGNFAPKDNQIKMMGPWTHIGTSVFNSNNNNNAYVGYMYGDIDGTTYEAVHSNTNSSTIKTYIDNWYTNKTNLGLSNDLIVADDYFCYDRSIYKGTVIGVDYSSGTGIGTVATAYGAAGRIWSSSSTFSFKTGVVPTFICPQANDMFTKTSKNVNNKTSVGTGTKVGLLSADEAVMMGQAGSTTYLYSGYYYWLGSPGGYISKKSYIFYATAGMGITYTSSSLPVRPVISVDTTYLTSGSGTAQNPWVFGS